jgi:hypothetical protein
VLKHFFLTLEMNFIENNLRGIKMKNKHIMKWTCLLMALCFVVSFTAFDMSLINFQFSPDTAFAKSKKTGPPQHAKAHGYRAKHTYRYYPDANAYYDAERKTYFYLEGNQWRVGVSLPGNLSVSLGNYVTIGMDSEKPYTKHEEHKRQYRASK